MFDVNVCAIIVSYNPSKELPDNVKALISQVRHLVIVDNGSRLEGLAVVGEVESLFHCHTILNNQNLGIAAALNLGIDYAELQGCEWVALFDQDSKVSDDFIASMLATFKQQEHPTRIGMLAPVYVDRRTGISHAVSTTADGYVALALTSGSMIPLAVFRECGIFEESMFIDYVDFEYCLRLRSHGFRIVQSTNAHLLHSLGAIDVHRIFGFRFATSNHGAARRYYITRNRVWLYRKYFREYFSWIVADFMAFLRETCKFLLVENDRLLKLRYTITGLLDAFRGAMGKRVPL